MIMEGLLKDLKPQSVFKNFEDLTKIPRGSGNEKQVSDYLVKFATDLGLDVIQEECLNVIIKKPGTKGYENSSSVILQGHMDMVCAKLEDLDFDFDKDPIPIKIDKDMIRTEGTTLGADNGIAVAMIMSILEADNLSHPPLTALITVAEETGMVGVLNLDPSHIEGDILINIDSEEEGIALASCAGGVKNVVSLPISFESIQSDNKKAFKISIRGLLGGHSGMEIDKHRGNAIKLIGRLLEGIEKEFEISISSIAGGEKMNAIPKMANAIIVTNSSNEDKLSQIINKFSDIFKNEYNIADPSIKLSIDSVELPKKIFTKTTKKALIDILRLFPNGIQTMSPSIEGLVESSNNIGVIVTENDNILISSAVRSSVRTLKYEINARIQRVCELTGASMELVSDYPEWQYKINSPIRELMVSTYEDIFNKELKIEAIHAGLECGFLKEKIGDIDMISIGPNLYDVHTPDEHLSISSTKRVYEFLCEVLKRLK